ncbi:TPA: hypothetical protein N0F65_000401 [Lagenidium giganteum]|uniref:Uncharacterized protein n=1 Tax=Lagenidium giganteum TaxID=4803 RepID=A0AAV2Z616_9STRA|nr:TPA: hypothetical protein N0F65_000401 [Lagenidium giganteum]
MLMDRGDGRPRIKSDHVGEPAMESEVVIDMDGMDVVPVAEPEEVDSIQQQEQEPSPAKPARPHSLSYDDIPIDSMYHRLRVQKMEEEEAARQAELRREAELREKEIQEFKAAMARS